jgi:hypothetical protein
MNAMKNDSTTFGTQTESFEIVGDQEGVMIVDEESGKVVMVLTETEVIELANILLEKAENEN